MAALTNSADGFEAGIRADQAAAEAGSQAYQDFYRTHDGVPVDTAGHAPAPVPVAGPAAVTGVPWDAQ